MAKKEIIAMLLAGGQGSRLKDLTKNIAKPAVSFGSKYRIIDFSLTNVSNSHIDTVGVLTQYKPQKLNQYLGTGESWDLDISDGGLHVLPPYATESGGRWYEGTADAIYRNMHFVDNYDPEYIVILSGDHIYKMDYQMMLDCHKKNNAELTVAVIKVPMKEASRFGIMTVDKDNVITKFTEKPKNPDSDLASMGIYIFTWKTLRKALIEDHKDKESEHDFGKNIIPSLLSQKKKLVAYEYSGYWMDVGTIQSYYDTQMDFLKDKPPFDIFKKDMRVFSNSNVAQPHFIGKEGKLTESLITNGCIIKGEVYKSIVSSEVYVDTGAKVDNSILLPGCKIEKGAKVSYAIVGENSVVKAKTKLIGKSNDIALIGDDVRYTGKGGKKQ